jgi:hypothetical protein
VLVKPDDVVSAMQDWQRGAETPDTLVTNWDKLGVVLETVDSAGDPAFIEMQRLLP